MHIDSKRVHEIVAKFSGVKILVVGDVMLDEFVWGKVNRISPEAPVPVVEVSSRSVMPGGAANVVNNIRSLGGEAALVGVCGDDMYGQILKQLLQGMGTDIEGLIAVKGHQTSLKSRIIAHNQQVVRVDTENRNGDYLKRAEKLLPVLEKKLKEVDVIIIEDYDKGLIHQELVTKIIDLATKLKKKVVVDPKKGNFLNYKGATLITPNKSEALAALGYETEDRAPAIEEVAAQVLKKWGVYSVLLTLGEDGMLLKEQDKDPFYIPTMAREVFDVSGAGDTVVATLAISLASGASFHEAAEISNYAASVVVGKVGTATLTAKELYQAMKIEHILES